MAFKKPPVLVSGNELLVGSGSVGSSFQTTVENSVDDITNIFDIGLKWTLSWNVVQTHFLIRRLQDNFWKKWVNQKLFFFELVDC